MMRPYKLLMLCVLIGCFAINSHSQITTQKSSILNVCNLNVSSKDISVKVEVFPLFNPFDHQVKSFSLKHKECLSDTFRIESLIIGRLYIDGIQKFYHILPDDHLTIEFYTEDSLVFKDRHAKYSEYAQLLPVVDLKELKKYQKVLPVDIYEYERTSIEYRLLLMKFYHSSFEEKKRIVDSLTNLNIDFTKRELLESGYFLSFLRDYFFFFYVKEMNALIKDYGKMSFSQQEIEREYYFESQFKVYRGKLSQRDFLDSARLEYWMFSLRMAKRTLPSELLDHYVFVHIMTMFKHRAGTYPKQHYEFAINTVKNEFLLNRLKDAYNTHVLSVDKTKMNIFNKNDP